MKKHLLLLGIFILAIVQLSNGQQATAVTSGASFQWADTQTVVSDPATLVSITINGLVYDQLVVPDGYEMTQVGPNGHAANRIKNNGATLFQNSSLPAWDSIALEAFQDFNLNNYFEASNNGRPICGDSVAASTTDAQKQSLTYDVGILSTPGAMVAVAERNANNCFYVELFGTPAGGGPDQLLGATFVRNNSTQWGNTVAPPPANVDYWNSGRTNENGANLGGASIGIAMFYLSDIAPLNSIVNKVTLTASTNDHGDGKIFIASLKTDLGINKTIDNNQPVVGSNITFTLIADNSNAAGIYADTGAVVNDILPSGYSYVSHTLTEGTYNATSGEWDLGTMDPGEVDTLTIVATVNPSGSYVNVARISGVLFDENQSNNNDTAIAYPIKPDPDFNVTYVNVPVPGDVSTNDENFPAGTTYGTPTAVPGNPDGSTPVINPDGTYTFVSPVPGVFEFLVPVCAPGVVMPNCQETLLTITVLDGTVNTNPPVANVDIATTEVNTPVTLNTLANDQAGDIDTELDPTSVTIVDSPSNGTVTVNPTTGETTYTPNEGFIGTDTLEYQVCDDANPTKCATAYQIIDVVGDDAPNTTVAADDYDSTPLNTPTSGNVSDNDNDPQGDNQTVTPQSTTIPGKGTLVLNNDGTYTFTPVTGFVGPVEFPYTTCDDGTPVACAEATLHILVAPNYPLNIDNIVFNGKTINGKNVLHWETINELNNQYFEIYHGSEVDQLKKIATVISKGEANIAGNWTYGYTHTSPIEGANNYYQLRTTDYNLVSKTHDIINLYVGENGSIVVYPNPATDVLNIAISGIEIEILEMQLLDYTGKTILSNTYTVDNDYYSNQISLKNLTTGIYFLRVIGLNGQQSTFKVEKR